MADADRNRPVLIVVADDAGVDAARNRGIVEGVTGGVIGALSVLATGDGLTDLAERLADVDPAQRPSLGLHLNLTEGHALSGPVPGVTDAAGAFLGDKQVFWQRALAGHVRADVLEREIAAQLDGLAAAGLVPERVDGHQHVHVLPGVRDAVARVAAARPELRWTRLGRPSSADVAEPSSFPCLVADRVAPAWRDLHRRGRVAQAALGTLHAECATLRSVGLHSTDVFCGVDLLVTPGLPTCTAEIRAAAELAGSSGGSIELMTHPGDCDASSVPFSADPARRAEVQVLCDPSMKERLDALGVRIGRFADLEAPA